MRRNERRWIFVATIASAVAGSALLAACGSSSPAPGTATVEEAIQTSCAPAGPPACTASMHFADIVPILDRSCTQCHSTDAADQEWPLATYSDVGPWADVIQDELCSYRMPPLDGGIPMTPADRLTVLQWVQCGSPD
jgi:uncharacterized membrane protein